MDLLAQLTTALGDPYRVERELGHGGMAVVFLAEHLKHRERAFEERSTILAYLLIDPRLAPLRDESRFVALARRLEGE